MTSYLDSNVCIAFIQLHHQFHSQAVKLLLSLASQAISPAISPLVLDETIHILLRDYRLAGVKHPEIHAKKDLQNFLKIPSLVIYNPPLEPKRLLPLFRYITLFHLKTRDALHLLTMKHNSIKYFATFDHDFDLVFSSHTLKQFSPS